MDINDLCSQGCHFISLTFKVKMYPLKQVIHKEHSTLTHIAYIQGDNCFFCVCFFPLIRPFGLIWLTWIQMPFELFTCWEIFHIFIVVCWLFSSKFTFSKNTFRNTIRVSIKQFGPRSGLTLSVLIWVKTACKGYQCHIVQYSICVFTACHTYPSLQRVNPVIRALHEIRHDKKYLLLGTVYKLIFIWPLKTCLNSLVFPKNFCMFIKLLKKRKINVLKQAFS